jgi:hypothetical protein
MKIASIDKEIEMNSNIEIEMNSNIEIDMIAYRESLLSHIKSLKFQ